VGRFPEEAGTTAWTGNGNGWILLEKVRNAAAHLHSDEERKEIN